METIFRTRIKSIVILFLLFLISCSMPVLSENRYLDTLTIHGMNITKIDKFVDRLEIRCSKIGKEDTITLIEYYNQKLGRNILTNRQLSIGDSLIVNYAVVYWKNIKTPKNWYYFYNYVKFADSLLSIPILKSYRSPKKKRFKCVANGNFAVLNGLLIEYSKKEIPYFRN